MYMKRMLEIGQASNGYVVECRVPLKPKSERKGKGEEKEVCECYPGSTEKQYIAKTPAEVVDIITRIMPLLDDTFTSEEQFDAAFEEAAAGK